MMLKKNETNTDTKKGTLPLLKKIKTDWDLKALFYKNENDTRIDTDVCEAEKHIALFAQKYKNGAFLRTHAGILKALTDYEALLGDPCGSRATYYFSYRHSLDVTDSVAEKRLNLLDTRLTKAGNMILFFELMLGKITRKEQQAILKDTALTHFRYYLSRVFENAKHTLTEPEEKVINIISQTAGGMWAQAVEKIVSNRSVTHMGKHTSLPEAIELINTLSPQKKQKLWTSILRELEQISEVAENELTAIATYKKNQDELRGYAKPYSATVSNYENDEKSIEALILAISTKGFALSHRFYALKAKYHGVKQIPYVNKYDPIGIQPKYSFEEAVTICRKVFYSVNTEYGKYFDDMLAQGHVDAYPKKGKRGGAFMSSGINLPTLVFLNHTNDLASLTTLAHEMGHATHSMRSKRESPLYEGYSTTTAETASTLFENILFDTLIKNADDTQKLSLLHERIMRTISSVQRQIAFFNFEKEMHDRVRSEGALTKVELRDMMQKHLKSYLGSAVLVTENDGYSYVYVQHFRYGFYVYTYAFGELMSMRMSQKLADDPTFSKKIDTFLSQGGNDTVDNIFKIVDLNTKDPQTFKDALRSLERDIDALEKLVKKSSRKTT